MSDPSLPLQAGLVAALKAYAPLTALIAGRVYDDPSKNAAKPYVTIGEDQVLPDRGDGYDGSDVTMTIHVWSEAVGFPQTKQIAGAIRAALAPGFAVQGHRLVDIAFESTRYLREPDGRTSHGVLTFTARTEPTD